MNAVAELRHVQQEPLPATLDKMEHAIALASNPEEINKVLALMDAAVAYAKRFYKDQQDVIARAKSLRLQAERRLGELLRDMPKQSGARGVGKSGIPNENSTLADMGIDAKTSSRAQRLAALPGDRFAAVTAGEISVADAIALPIKHKPAKTKAREVVHQHKTVIANEGSTYLIAAMRSAYNAIEEAGEHIEEQEKAVAMAEKLAIRLVAFLAKYESAIEGNTASL